MTAPAIPRSTALTEAGREWSAQLGEAEARVLTAQIRASVEVLLPLIRAAYQGRADLALGYPTWFAYCDAELSGLRLDVADRAEAVAGLRADGMSTRAIGAALGMSKSAVARELATVPDGTVPDRIAGLDGREQPASRPTSSPGPVDAAVPPPADPGAIPEPGAVLSTAQPGSGTPAPAVEPPTSPVAPQEPGPDVPPRKPAPEPSAEQRAALPGAVLGVLADADPVIGLTRAEIWTRLPMQSVHSSWVEPVLHELADAGRVLVVGHGTTGARWVVTPEPDGAVAAVPSGSGSSAAPVPGGGGAAAAPPAVWTPEQHEEHRLGVQRKQAVDAAHRFAGALVLEVRGMVTTIIDGIDHGAPASLVTAEMIAECRAALDRLEARVAA